MSPRFRATLASLVLTLATLPCASHVAAQLPPISVPKGLTRFTMDGALGSYDHRFFDSRREPLASDFAKDSVGANFFGALTAVEEILKRVTGIPTAGLNIGSTNALQQISVGTSGIGLAHGLTRRLTIFGYMPFTRVTVQAHISLDSTGARSGFNPADPIFGDPSGAGQTASFFAQFNGALANLQEALDGGAFDNDPAKKQQAQQTLTDGTALHSDLFALILDPARSTFMPKATSPEGVALLNKIAALQNLLVNNFGVTGFTLTPSLPTSGIGDEAFQELLTNPDGPIAGSLDVPNIYTLGDVEVGAAYLLLDNRSETGEGIALTGEAMARLPTSKLDRPELLFDLGTGDRQPDAEFRLTADLVARRFGIRMAGGYAIQLSGKLQRRIAPPSQPIAYASTLAAVTRTPGNVVVFSAQPFYRITPTFAFVAGARYASRSMDTYDLFENQDSIPNAPPSLLAEESARKWYEVSGGLAYSSPHIPLGDKPKMPMDAGMMFSSVVGASGGRVPAAVTVRAYLKLYARFP